VSLFRTRLTNANAPIAPDAADFEEIMRELELPVRITEIVRSRTRQEDLYAQGRTKPGPIVTWTRSSQHIRGRAFDFAFRDPAIQRDTDDDAWDVAGEVLHRMGLVWGPDLGIADFGHAQLPSDAGDS